MIRISNLHTKLTKEFEGLIFTGDYKAQLDRLIGVKKESLIKLPSEERNQAIETLTDVYIDQTGERPGEDALYELTDIVLYNYLEGDTRRTKMQVEEYPILTEGQYEFRTQAKTRERNAQGVAYREVSLEAASYIGTDGENHTLPIRKYK